MFVTYGLIRGVAVIDASWEGDQFSFGQEDTDPSVLLVSDIKVCVTIQDVTDLVIHMEVLSIQDLQLTDTKRHTGLSEDGSIGKLIKNFFSFL